MEFLWCRRIDRYSPHLFIWAVLSPPSGNEICDVAPCQINPKESPRVVTLLGSRGFLD